MRVPANEPEPQVHGVKKEEIQMQIAAGGLALQEHTRGDSNHAGGQVLVLLLLLLLL